VITFRRGLPSHAYGGGPPNEAERRYGTDRSDGCRNLAEATGGVGGESRLRGRRDNETKPTGEDTPKATLVPITLEGRARDRCFASRRTPRFLPATILDRGLTSTKTKAPSRPSYLGVLGRAVARADLRPLPSITTSTARMRTISDSNRLRATKQASMLRASNSARRT